MAFFYQHVHNDLIIVYTDGGGKGETSFLLKTLGIEVLSSGHWPYKIYLVRSFWVVCRVHQTASNAQPLSCELEFVPGL